MILGDTASTWIKRGILLLGFVKTAEIVTSFMSGLISLKMKESGKNVQKSTEKGFLYQRLEDVEEVHLSHGPSDSLVRKRPLLQPLAIPNVVGFSEAVIPPGTSVERHVHASKYETFFCIEGQGYINIGTTKKLSSDDEVLELIPGSCVTVVPKFYHSLHNNGTRNLVLLYFGVAR